MRLSTRVCFPLLPALLPTAVVFANPGGIQTLGMEEVVVTANRRESLLLETPSSVTAFDQDAREQLGIFNPRDLEQHTPSLKITRRKIVIRGVGRPNNALGSDPGVGIYWDGVYQTENGIFNRNDYLDIERIEILRGPQGTLYGRNTIGGAVNFISQKPGDELSGKVIAQVGNYDARTVQGLVSGPMTKKLSGLAALSQKTFGGTQENIYNGKHYGKIDQFYGSAALNYQTTERWNNYFRYFHSTRDDRENMGAIREPFSRDYVQQIVDQDTGELANLPGMFPGQNFVNMRQGLKIENPTLADVDHVKVDADPFLNTTASGVTWISQFDADSYSLKYTGAYYSYDYDYSYDADHSVMSDSGLDWRLLDFAGTPVSELTGYTVTPNYMLYTENQDAYFQSHELQFLSNWDSTVSLIAGLYYYRSVEDQLVTYREMNDDVMAVYEFFGEFLGLPVSTNNFLYRGEANLTTVATAAYAQVDWSFLANTSLTLGIRYSNDSKKGGDNTFVQYVGDVDNPTVFRDVEDDWSKVTWRVGLEHNITDYQFVYGFVATGYRSGGFNLQKPTASPDVDTVDPENLLSYEIGYKSVLWRNRINLGVAAYYYDYTDLQVLKNDVVNGITLFTFENADDADAYGVELEGSLLITDGLLFSGTYSYNRTEYKNFQSDDGNACSLGPLAEGNSLDPLCSQEQDLAGNQFPLTPVHKASANLTYSWDGLGLAWSTTISWLYTGSLWMTQFNNPDYDRIEAWDTWNWRFNLGSPHSAWVLTAYVDNIADDRATWNRDRPSTVTHNAISSVNTPRTYGLRFQYNF